jgi:hypothetical protein
MLSSIRLMIRNGSALLGLPVFVFKDNVGNFEALEIFQRAASLIFLNLTFL